MVFPQSQERPRDDAQKNSHTEASALLMQLRDARDLSSRRELIKTVYERLLVWLDTRGLKLGDDIQSVYDAMARVPSRELLVRQERIDNVVALLVDRKVYELSPKMEKGASYANAAAFGATGDGAGIAFSEGSATKY